MKKILKCTLIIIILLGVCCSCATEQTDKYWKSNMEVIVDNEENNLIEMWGICNKNEITDISIAKDEEIQDPRCFNLVLNNTKYIVAFKDRPDISDETKLQLNRLCEIYEALMKNYKIVGMSCYYLNDPTYNYMIIDLVDTTFYRYSLEYYPPKAAIPEDVYMKEYHTQIKDGFYMELYKHGF